MAGWDVFLSCLSGSEPRAAAAFVMSVFLSCLSGSERDVGGFGGDN